MTALRGLRDRAGLSSVAARERVLIVGARREPDREQAPFERFELEAWERSISGRATGEIVIAVT
jgi:hypothetical protein